MGWPASALAISAASLLLTANTWPEMNSNSLPVGVAANWPPIFSKVAMTKPNISSCSDGSRIGSLLGVVGYTSRGLDVVARFHAGLESGGLSGIPVFRSGVFRVLAAVLADKLPVDRGVELLALDPSIREPLDLRAVLGRHVARFPPLLDDLITTNTKLPRHGGESLEVLDSSFNPVHGTHIMLVFLVLLVYFVWPQYFLVGRIRA